MTELLQQVIAEVSKLSDEQQNAIELLCERAINDPDEKLREWAQEQLKIYDSKIKVEVSSNG